MVHYLKVWTDRLFTPFSATDIYSDIQIIYSDTDYIRVNLKMSIFGNVILKDNVVQEANWLEPS